MVAKKKTATKKPAPKKKSVKLTAEQTAKKARQAAFLADYEALCRKHNVVLEVGYNWDWMPIDCEDEDQQEAVCENTWVQVEFLGAESDDLIDIHVKKTAKFPYW